MRAGRSRHSARRSCDRPPSASSLQRSIVNQRRIRNGRTSTMTSEVSPIPVVTRRDPAAHSGDLVAENIATLKALFPTIVTDSKIDLAVLGQLLGNEVEGPERYGLSW